jgi:NAD+ kinase
MLIDYVGIIANSSKPKALELASKVVEQLKALGVTVRIDAIAAKKLSMDDISCQEACLDEMQLMITLGGDGTILTATHIAAPRRIPILGVHLGRFGFISEASPEELIINLPNIIMGRYEIEERMMIRGEVIRDGKTIFEATGLNDIVVNKGARSRMLHLATSFGAEKLTNYLADGVIVATPTGSTAYALSAGGPLVAPTVQAFIVAPICAHTLNARPIVIPADEIVNFSVESDGGEVLFVADSYRVTSLNTGDKVRAQRANYNVQLVRLKKGGFYRKIRQRLLWGERVNG